MQNVLVRKRRGRVEPATRTCSTNETNAFKNKYIRAKLSAEKYWPPPDFCRQNLEKTNIVEKYFTLGHEIGGSYTYNVVKMKKKKDKNQRKRVYLPTVPTLEASLNALHIQ